MNYDSIGAASFEDLEDLADDLGCDKLVKIGSCFAEGRKIGPKRRKIQRRHINRYLDKAEHTANYCNPGQPEQVTYDRTGEQLLGIAQDLGEAALSAGGNLTLNLLKIPRSIPLLPQVARRFSLVDQV